MNIFPGKTFFTLILCLTATTAINNTFAQAYKCVKNGATTYSQTACHDGVSTSINLQSGEVPSEDYQEGLKKNNRDALLLKQLETSRQKKDAKYEKEVKASAAKYEKKTEKCDALKLKEKWAKEDMVNASPRAEKKARTHYKRATEKTALHCKTY